MKSFEYKTVTLEHPEENGLLTMITNENVSKHKKGTIISVFEEDNKLGAILQVESKDAIDFINQKRSKWRGYTIKCWILCKYSADKQR